MQTMIIIRLFPIRLSLFQTDEIFKRKRPILVRDESNLMTLNITAVLGHGQAPDLNKRLVYFYQQDLLVTGNFWHVILNLDLNWYQTHLDVIGIILKQINVYQSHIGW
jgi:hypothetical protein